MTELVCTVLEDADIARINALAADLGLTREDVVQRLVIVGLPACEQEAAGDVEAPPVSRSRLRQGAW